MREGGHLLALFFGRQGKDIHSSVVVDVEQDTSLESARRDTTGDLGAISNRSGCPQRVERGRLNR